MSNLSVLIVGQGGFLGSSLKNYLVDLDYRVKGISRSTRLRGDKSVDITSSIPLDSLEGFSPEVVVNCAAQLPANNPFDPAYVKKCFDVNASGALNVAQFAQRVGAKLVVHCSTLSVVKKPWPVGMKEEHVALPLDDGVAYGMSKLAGEALLESFCQNIGMEFCTLRLAALYGPGMPKAGVIYNFINQAATAQSIKCFNAEKVFADFLFIEDAVKLIEQVIKKKAQGLIQVASGTETSLLDLAKVISACFSPTKVTIQNTSDAEFPTRRASVSNERLMYFLGSPWQFTDLSKGILATIPSFDIVD